MSRNRRKNEPSLREFSIDREETSIVLVTLQYIGFAICAVAGNWIFVLLVENGWYTENFFTKIIAFAFTPLWIISLFITLFLVWIFGALIWSFLMRRYGGKGNEPDREAIFLGVIRNDGKTLAKKRMQLSTKDEFGIPNTTKWEKELRRYIRDVLPQKLDPEYHGFGVLWLSSQKNVQKLRDLIDTEYQALLSEDTKIDELNPLEYEQYCSRRLETMGWASSITRASGDQGADVLAHKDGHSLVLQCKKYSKPIGNKAVQEAIAAQKYYRTDMAAVVTNQSFTKSARELADMSGILLLHHTELDLFA